MNPILQFLLTRGVGRLLRKGLTFAAGWLLAAGLPGLKDGTIENLVEVGVGLAGLGLSWAWSRWHDKLVFAKALAGKSGPSDSACPKTLQVLRMSAFLALVLAAQAVTAQTVTNSAQASAILQGNPLGGPLQAGLSQLDTNSQFFASTKVAFRTGAVLRGKTAGAVTGADYNFSRSWMACVDVIEGPANATVDAVQALGGYRLPIHNLEVDSLAGAGYRWDDLQMRVEGIVAFQVCYSFNEWVYTFTRAGLEFNSDRPSTQIIAGVGVRLPEMR